MASERLEKLKRGLRVGQLGGIMNPDPTLHASVPSMPTGVTTGPLTAEVAAQARKDGLVSGTPLRNPDGSLPCPVPPVTYCQCGNPAAPGITHSYERPCVDMLLRRPDDAKEPMKDRLPDRSKFEGYYDADKKSWHGWLGIPAGESTEESGYSPVFEVLAAPSIKRLCFALDELWRRHLASQPKEQSNGE